MGNKKGARARRRKVFGKGRTKNYQRAKRMWKSRQKELKNDASDYNR
jgi:hypothetical protein